MNKMTLADTGRYICTANNTYGEDRCDTEVTVTGESQFLWYQPISIDIHLSSFLSRGLPKNTRSESWI